MVKLGLVRRVLIWVLRAEIKVEVTEVDFGAEFNRCSPIALWKLIGKEV